MALTPSWHLFDLNGKFRCIIKPIKVKAPDTIKIQMIH